MEQQHHTTSALNGTTDDTYMELTEKEKYREKYTYQRQTTTRRWKDPQYPMKQITTESTPQNRRLSNTRHIFLQINTKSTPK